MNRKICAKYCRYTGGRCDHSRRCPRRRPQGRATLQKSKSSAAAAPTSTSTLTGPHVIDRPMREDDVEAGVPLTRILVTMVATTTTVGAPPRCPTGSGTTLRPPSKGTRRNLAPRGLWCPPRPDQDRLGVGGAPTPTTGLDDHRNPDGGNVNEGIEGGEDGSCDFEQALYVARFAPPMPLRG